MTVTVRNVSIRQLVEELDRIRFAGYGDSLATFATAGDMVLTVSANKDMGTVPAPKAAPRPPTKASK